MDTVRVAAPTFWSFLDSIDSPPDRAVASMYTRHYQRGIRVPYIFRIYLNVLSVRDICYPPEACVRSEVENNERVPHQRRTKALARTRLRVGVEVGQGLVDLPRADRPRLHLPL